MADAVEPKAPSPLVGEGWGEGESSARFGMNGYAEMFTLTLSRRGGED